MLHFLTMVPNVIYTVVECLKIYGIIQGANIEHKMYFLCCSYVSPFVFKFCCDINTRRGLVYNSSTEPTTEFDRVH